MQITTLFQVVNYLKDLSGNQTMLDMYQKLSEMILEASRNQDKNYADTILEQKEELCKVLLNSDPTSWGYASYSLFEKLNVKGLFGKPAADHLEDVIDHGVKDYNAAYKFLNRTTSQIGKFSDSISKFCVLFDLIVPKELFHEPGDEFKKSSLFLHFEGELSVHCMADLERYSRLWNVIFASFSRLTEEETPSLDICNFNHGDIILGVSVSDTNLDIIISGFSGILSVLPDILNIRKIKQEISHIPLHIDLNELLDEEVEILISKTALDVAKNLTADNPEKEVLQSDLARSLKQVLSFVEKGGKIEYRPSSSTREITTANESMINSFMIVRELLKLNIIDEKPEKLS